MGFFKIIKQEGNGNCVFYTLAGMKEPKTLEYEREKGIVRDRSERQLLEKAANQQRMLSADIIDRHDASRQTSYQLEKLLDDRMMEHQIPRAVAIERIRKVRLIITIMPVDTILGGNA